MPVESPVGIDFGTATCKLAVLGREGRVQIVNIGQDITRLMPSIVYFPESRAPARGVAQAWPEVGRRAEGSISSRRSQRTWPSSEKGHLPIKLGLGNPDFKCFEDDGKVWDAPAMATEIFRAIALTAQGDLGYIPSQAIITHPAYFTQAQIQMIREAARLAGLNVPFMHAEPVAAALAHWRRTNQEGNYVVYDFGGGTFDTTVLTIRGQEFRVLAKLGNPALGGLRLDDLVYEALLRPKAEAATGLSLSTAKGKPLRGDAGVNHSQLYPLAREIKETLSDAERCERQVDLTLDKGQKTVTVEYLITRDELVSVLDSDRLLTSTMEIVDQVLELAGMSPSEVDHVLPVGGVTRMPFIRDMLARKLPDKLSDVWDPDTMAAQGAAILAADNALSHVRVTDVLARSLRLREAGKTTTRVLVPRGTSVDAAETRFHVLWPSPDAKRVVLELCEGEADEFLANDGLGAAVIEAPGRLDKGAKVAIQLRYDGGSGKYAFSVNGGAPTQLTDLTDVPKQGTQAWTSARTRISDIVVCLDVSYSFRRSLFDQVRESVLSLADALESAGTDCRWAVVAFSDGSADGTEPHVDDFTYRGLDGLLGSLPKWSGGDDPEDVGAALRRAADLLRHPRPEAQRLVLLFTDAPPRPHREFDVSQVTLQSQGVPVYVFGPQQPFERVYLRLAESTGGHYWDIRRELAPKISELSRLLTGKGGT